MFYVATALLFDRNSNLLIYLRDDKSGISFPNHWDLFGGIIEAGEFPVQALKREIEEEIGIQWNEFTPFRTYEVMKGDIGPNIKYVFYAKLTVIPEELTLREGQRLTSIPLSERHLYQFANVLGKIIDDFALSGIIPK